MSVTVICSNQIFNISLVNLTLKSQNSYLTLSQSSKYPLLLLKWVSVQPWSHLGLWA